MIIFAGTRLTRAADTIAQQTGWGRLLVGGSLSSFLAMIALMRLLGIAKIDQMSNGFVFDAKARREERWLREQFPDYAGYEKRVRRFVPWIY